MQAQKKLKKKPPKEYMSASELKVRLFDRFQETGVLDGMQTELRSKLINEMFKVSSSKRENKRDKIDSKEALLPLQVSNWLVYDHLKRLNYEYSLSTFVSESKISDPEKLLSITDILHLIGYDSNSPECESLLSNYKKSDSFLVTFLKSVVKHSQNSHAQNFAGHSSQKESLLPVMESFLPSKVFGDILHESTLSSGVCSGKTREDMTFQRYLKLEKEKHEREIQILRQKLVQELDSLHEQEQHARLEVEQMRNKLTLEKETLTIEKEKLQRKELELRTKEERIEEEMKKSMKLHEENLLKDQKVKEAFSWEVKLKEQQQWLEKELSKLKDSSLESEQLKTQLLHMEKSYKSLESDYTVILRENENLQMKLKNMSDYSTIKQELSWKSAKLENFEQEVMHLKREMQAEKMASLNTIHRLQQQLLFMVPKQGVESYNHGLNYNASYASNIQTSNMQQEYGNMKQLYETVLKRIVEQKEDIQELHRLIHGLYNEVTQRKDTTSKPYVEKQNTPASANKAVGGQVSNTYQNSKKAENHSQSSSTHCNTLPVSSQEKYIEKPLKFIAEAKKRIETLQKESETLERKYSNFFSSAPWIPSVPLLTDDISSNEFLETMEAPTQDIFYFDVLSGPPFKNDFTATFSMPDRTKATEYRNTAYNLSKKNQFQSDLLVGESIDHYPLIDFSASEFLSHINRNQTESRTLDSLSSIKKNITSNISSKVQEKSEFSETRDNNQMFSDNAEKQKSGKLYDQSANLQMQSASNPLDTASDITNAISNLNHNFKDQETNLMSQVDKQAEGESHTEVQAVHTSAEISVNSDSDINEKAANTVSAKSSQHIETVTGQKTSLKQAMTENFPSHVSGDSSAGVETPAETLASHSSMHDVNMSPFRRRRRFIITPPQGYPVIDLDEAWKKRKSIDSGASNIEATIQNESEKQKLSSKLSELSDNNLISNDRNIHGNDASTPSLNTEMSKTEKPSLHENNNKTVTSTEKEQTARNKSTIGETKLSDKLDHTPSDVYPSKNTKETVSNSNVNPNLLPSSSTVEIMTSSNTSTSLPNVQVSTLEQNATSEVVRDDKKAESDMPKEDNLNQILTPNVSDKESEKVQEDDNLSELSELKLSAGSTHEQTQTETDDDW